MDHHEQLWYPLGFLKIYHPLTTVHGHTVLYTWAAIFALIIFVLIGRAFIRYPEGRGAYIFKQIIQSFIDLVDQSVGKFVEHYFMFISSLFLFILACNWIALIPGLEEPTKDLNTALALGFTSLFYVHKETIKSHGIVHYLEEYFVPFKRFFPLNILAGIAILPLKILGELATAISLSFRLFGNIFGGSIIMDLAKKALGESIILNFIATAIGFNLILMGFFIIFEGILQAFVFSILSLTNLAMAVQTEDSIEPEDLKENI